MGFLLFFLALSTTSCYTLKQAFHFNNLFNSRRLVSEVISDPQTSPQLKERLIFSQRVLDFAKAQGLDTSNSYQYYIHLGKTDVSHVVQAAHPDRLAFVTWWFPFVGSVPYLGYFDKSERDLKAKELSEKYDVHKARVGAFSSLGWFHDPIYTPMLRKSEPDLAHLLFHELTHRTFWSQGSVTFNENLAEFSAGVLTVKLLAYLGRKDDISQYRKGREDRLLLRQWLRRFKSALTEIYAQKKTREEKLAEKQRVISLFLNEKRPTFENKRYEKYIDQKVWNNASILAASLYTPDTGRFADAFSCLNQPSMGLFLEAIEEAEDNYNDAFSAMDSLCRATKKDH